MKHKKNTESLRPPEKLLNTEPGITPGAFGHGTPLFSACQHLSWISGKDKAAPARRLTMAAALRPLRADRRSPGTALYCVRNNAGKNG